MFENCNRKIIGILQITYSYEIPIGAKPNIILHTNGHNRLDVGDTKPLTHLYYILLHINIGYI